MLCEKCKKNPATVHMQTNINGEKTETHLCELCAGKADNQISFDNFFQGFLDMLMNAEAGDGIYAQPLPLHYQCGGCGLTYEGFKKARKFGCDQCYETFREQLYPVLKNIHGSSYHQGKFPKKSGEGLKIRHEIEKYKLQLAKAIENEEYEEAAKLRDSIRNLERDDINGKMV